MVLLNTKQSFPESLNDIHNHLKRYPHHSILKSQPSLWSIDDRLKTDSLSLRRLSTNDSMPSLTKSETAYSSDSTFDHRRHCVLQEWLMTEKAYLADLELIQEIYMNPHVFSQSESRQIFLNLPEIILFSREWIVAMETHLSVGALCNTMMHTMEQVYTEFCIKHQDSLQRLHVMIHTQPLIHRFIKQSNKQLSGRTTCWDLESLLIKPVQRILKYPLLIKELIQSTPKQHEDYDQLILALHNIKQIANQINETKRRKDFVEQLIHPKHKNNVRWNKGYLSKEKHLIYHLHKKLNRKKNKVICQTHDSQFDALYHTFQQKQALAHELKQAIEDWLLSIRENVEALSCLVDNLESIYDDSDGIGLRSIQSLKSLVAHLEAYPWATFVQHNIYRQMDDYLKTFRNPEQVIQKRKKALVAYDTMLYSTKTSDEKELHVSYSVYCSLNQVLLDELPVFFKLCDAYFDILLQDFATLQSSFYRFQQTEWKVLTAELPFGRDHGWSSIQDGYLHSLKRLQIRLNEIQSIRQ
ncbi:Dynamin-binding protein [Choanephora cucurbitarum]|uniref:Dynamin-binding protein n=1 Tax=Choanephora cucurbitarum TaxID=101091 RepID=A0A1C7N330_9FUNG|nr:Dynamin-binding protein [Choanephora cucurbitarum]